MTRDTIRLDFLDFWPGFRKDSNYFIDLLERRFRVELHAKPDFVIYADFGHAHRLHTGTRIYFSGEANRPDFRCCDYALTCHYLDDPRHFRLPLYAVYGGGEQLLKLPDEPVRVLAERRGFCSFVVSNPQARERIAFFERLSRYKRVDSGGRYLNNIGRSIGESWEGKQAFLRQYKFNIAFENQALPGYTTEKLADAMQARCIPIYWGSSRVHEEFNPRSFLNYADFSSEEALIERIIQLDQDDALCLEMLRQPYFHDNRMTEAYRGEQLLDFFSRIFHTPIQPVATRRSPDVFRNWTLARRDPPPDSTVARRDGPNEGAS
jgi:hypothetical protein